MNTVLSTTRDGYRTDVRGDIELAGSTTTRAKLLYFAKKIDEMWVAQVKAYVFHNNKDTSYEYYEYSASFSKKTLTNNFTANTDYYTDYHCNAFNSRYRRQWEGELRQ